MVNKKLFNLCSHNVNFLLSETELKNGTKDTSKFARMLTTR